MPDSLAPDALISELAKRTGVVFERNDPMLHIAELLNIYREQDKAAAVRVAAELPRALDRLVRQRAPWRRAQEATLALALLCAGAVAGYCLHGDARAVTGLQAVGEHCEDRPDGSRLCWFWTRLPQAKGH